MTEVAARPWLLAAGAQLALAALAGVLVAAGIAPPFTDLLLGCVFVFLACGGLAYGYAPPFLKREPLAAWPAHAALGLALAADVAVVAGPRWGAYAAGLAFLALPMHLGASAVWGVPWRGGIALFAKDQPYRRGDRVAAAAFAVSLIGLGWSGVLLLAQPRGLLSTGILVALLGFALPFLAGAMAFFLPRNAKRPLDGATLVVAALGLLAFAVLGLVVAFLLPGLQMFRWPAATVLLAELLFLVAMLRVRFEAPGPQARRALPLLRGAAALLVLAGLLLALAMAGSLPGPLLRPAAYAHLLLAAVAALAACILGAPVLLNAVPREGAWPKAAAGVAIAGLVVLAYAPFVGSFVVAVAAAVALWGVAPMRTPRRDCP